MGGRVAEAEKNRSPQLIYKFIALTIGVPRGFLVDLGNVILKLIWQRKCPGTAKNIVKNNSERGWSYWLSQYSCSNYNSRDRDKESRNTLSSYLWELSVG